MWKGTVIGHLPCVAVLRDWTMTHQTAVVASILVFVITCAVPSIYLASSRSGPRNGLGIFCVSNFDGRQGKADLDRPVQFHRHRQRIPVMQSQHF